MENILITFAPEGRNTASKLKTVLKNLGYPSTLGVDSLKKDDLPKFIIAVLTPDSESDKSMCKIMSDAGAYNINVVLFVSAELPDNMTSRFFLDEHVWIDNIKRKFEDSAADLGDLLKLNFAELSKKAEKKSDKTAAIYKSNKKKESNNNNNTNPSLYRNLFYASLAVIAVMLFILINGSFTNGNREANNQRANYQNGSSGNNKGQELEIKLSSDLKKSESSIVGHWKMVDYSDNQFRATHEDSLNLQNLIDALLQRAQLVFNSDKTFSRLGYSDNVETGNWEYDPQSKYLKLQPTGVNQYDVVQIQDVSETTLVIVVSEKHENNQIITKMTFQKIN